MVESDSSGRVLIVDDEPVILHTLTVAFSDAGFEVTGARSVAAATAHMSEKEFDLALIDKNLPEVSGIEMIRDVRSTDSQMGVILITAYGSPNSAKETLNLGIDAYLEKPFPDVFAVVGLGRDVVRKRRADRPKPARTELPSILVIARDPWMSEQLVDPVDRRKATLRTSDGDPEEVAALIAARSPDIVVLDAGGLAGDLVPLVILSRQKAPDAALVVGGKEPLDLGVLKDLIREGVSAVTDSRAEYIWKLRQLVERMQPKSD